MLKTFWTILKRSVEAFIEDNALSRGAAIAFYAVTSIGPVLLIVVAVAGLVYGRDAARGALVAQLTRTMGRQSAAFLQLAVGSADNHSAGVMATIIGIVSLIVTASGVFGEMQSALNQIWRASPEGATMTRLIKARLTSLGLVVALGLLLLVSLVIGTAIAAIGHALNSVAPFADTLLYAVNFTVSLLFLTGIIMAIYKVLPDKRLRWRDTIVGALVTALLISFGKLAIGIYLGTSAITSSYGAAGSVLAALLWVYYSAEIFLFGAEFTRAYAERKGTPAAQRESVEAT